MSCAPSTTTRSSATLSATLSAAPSAAMAARVLVRVRVRVRVQWLPLAPSSEVTETETGREGLYGGRRSGGPPCVRLRIVMNRDTEGSSLFPSGFCPALL